MKQIDIYNELLGAEMRYEIPEGKFDSEQVILSLKLEKEIFDKIDIRPEELEQYIN